MRYLHGNRGLAFRLGLLLITLTTSSAVATFGQEIEPRTYARAPVGTQSVVALYTYQTGDVVTDTNVPLRDVNVRMNVAAFAYGRTFGLAKRQLNVGVVVPYFKGRVTGEVFEERREVFRTGIGDTRVRLSYMLRGAPALTPKEFGAFKPKSIFGVGLTVSIPTGEYDHRKLINIGANRFSLKPEVGVAKTIQRWTVEAAVAVWLFSANKRFFGESTRSQEPLLSVQSHIIYTLKPRMWLAVSGTYYNGGRTTVNGVLNTDMQNNARFGATLAYPVTGQHSLKLAVTRGATTRIGGNLTAVTAGWQYTWF